MAKKSGNETTVLPVVKTLVSTFGYHLVHALLQGMSGIFPSRCCDDIAEILRELMDLSPEVQEKAEFTISTLPNSFSLSLPFSKTANAAVD